MGEVERRKGGEERGRERREGVHFVGYTHTHTHTPTYPSEGVEVGRYVGI